MKKVLIIEDDENINNLIKESLIKNKVNCTQAFSGTEGLLCIENNDYDLILLDLMLPGMKGEDVLKHINKNNNIPIIVVSAKDELDTKVDLLSLGAEDYITKPFEIRELIARVFVQLRRNDKKSDNFIIEYKDMKLNKNTYEVYLKNKLLNLTRQEYKILELLLENKDKVFSKEEIYEYAWNELYIGEDKTINVHISNIRSKIKKITDEPYIETVWGIGFKIKN